jgi:hypothetical protein
MACVVWCAFVATTLYVVCCIGSKGCSELLFCCNTALGRCTLRSRGVPCGVQHVWGSFCCIYCVVGAGRCSVRVGCCRRHRVTVRRACVQRDDGGVLVISGGSATFESVAISDTTAAVRVAGEADRARGGLGRRCAVRWRGDDGRRVCRVQGRQHRTLFGGARSSLLTGVHVAGSNMGCRLRCMGCGACCNVCCARCTYV